MRRMHARSSTHVHIGLLVDAIDGGMGKPMPWITQPQVSQSGAISMPFDARDSAESS